MSSFLLKTMVLPGRVWIARFIKLRWLKVHTVKGVTVESVYSWQFKQTLRNNPSITFFKFLLRQF